MSDIEIEIDGKPLTVKPNSMVIQAADAAGIYIPRFCYHKHLAIAANCRMCLVEVEKSAKPLPACATPVAAGMKIFTRSAKALAAQKAVMEFLLINHPLDCPICDQGGECELQDLSMEFGSADSFYTFGKRAVEDEDIGPLVATEMTRCIQCTRCVRFGDEIAGMRELGATGRGERMEIGTYVAKAMRSEISGNIIDLCPVGALTSKPFRFTARPWELHQYPTIAPHDCLGSNIYVHNRNGKVMRVVPRENVLLNETWISDRDRFSYEGLYHAERLEKPMVLIDEQWRETDWQTALEAAANGLQQVIHANGAEQIGALASPSATLEELYLLQKLMRQLGSSNIDHRLRQVDFSDQQAMPIFPGIATAVTEIAAADVILLIGANIQKEQPIAAIQVRKAVQQGAQVIAVNMLDYAFNFKVAGQKIAAPQHFVAELAGLTKALVGERAELAEIMSGPTDSALAELLRAGKNVCVLIGAPALNHPEAAQIRALTQLIAKTCNTTCGFLTEGANTAGAWLAGAVPHRKPVGEAIAQPGLNAATMWQDPRRAYVLLNVEPELDCANPVAAQQALSQADFVLAFSLFKNPALQQYAKVILPIAAFAETSGTFVNAVGDWQTFQGVATAPGDARPAWKVLRVLGNLLHCEGFDYTSTQEIQQELQVNMLKFPTPNAHFTLAPISKKAAQNGSYSRIGDVPLYAHDSLVRHAKSLQAAQLIIEENLVAAHLHPTTAAQLHVQEADRVLLQQGENRICLPVAIDQRVPPQAAFVAGGILATSQLNELFGPIEMHKA